ncbi:MAG: hypothetical protein ABR985_00835 [Methanotrichaceae archaeon]
MNGRSRLEGGSPSTQRVEAAKLKCEEAKRQAREHQAKAHLRRNAARMGNIKPVDEIMTRGGFRPAIPEEVA